MPSFWSQPVFQSAAPLDARVLSCFCNEFGIPPCGSALWRRCASSRGTYKRQLRHGALPSWPGACCIGRRAAALENAAKQHTVRATGSFGPFVRRQALSAPLVIVPETG